MREQIRTMRDQSKVMWACPILLAAVATWLFPGPAYAQVGLAVEGRVGVTLPQGDLSDAGAESGIELGAELQASFSPSLTAYLGVHRYAFSCESGCSLGDSPKSTGVAAGLKYIFHNPGDATVWGRAGIVANTLSAEDVPDDRGIGFEVGLGADMPIGTRLYVVPNVGYISHDAGDGFTAGFFTLGVGLHYHVR